MGFTTGFSRGIIRTATTIVSLFVGFLAGVQLGPAVGHFLQDLLGSDGAYFPFIGFLVVFSLILWALYIIASQLEKLLSVAGIGFVNRFLGGAAIGIIYAVLFSALLWFASQVGMVPQQQISQSLSYPYLMMLPEIATDVSQQVQPAIRDFSENLNELFDGLSNDIEQHDQRDPSSTVVDSLD